jgi:hypothetical protein
MASKQMIYSQEARQNFLQGLSKLARAVKVTMGHQGRRFGPRKSNCPARSRTWARRWSTRSPRPTTRPATARPPRPCSAESDLPKASSYVTAGANPMSLQRGIDRRRRRRQSKPSSDGFQGARARRPPQGRDRLGQRRRGDRRASSPRRSKRSARTAWSTSKKARRWRPSWSSSRACSSTRASSRRTS